MEYSEHKPIYLQNVDLMQEKILRGEWREEERIPSVREMGAMVGVNPNTVMRSYERRDGDGIIFNRRGIGYFVAEGAKEHIREIERRKFLDEELPKLSERLNLLGLTIEVKSTK